MTRPIPNDIEATGEGWDAFVDQNFDLVFVQPTPLALFGTLSALNGIHSPLTNGHCLAVVGPTPVSRLALASDTVWMHIPVQADALVNLTDSSGGTSGGNTIALVTSVATAADAIATLAAKLNDLLTKLRASSAIQ